MRTRLANPQVLLWTVLLVLLAVVTLPIFWAVLASFKTNMEIVNQPFSLPKSWSFDNYAKAWDLGNFSTYFWNTTIITIGGMLLVLIVACPAGYAFAQIKFKGNNLIFYLFLLGMALPVQAIIIPVFYQLKSIGLVDSLSGVVLVSAGLALPFSVFLMRNTMKDIQKELRESAYVDGASEWRAFFSIMLPLAKPAVVALLVFTFMSIWNDFLLPLVLLISNENFTLSLGLLSFQGENSTNFGLIFAGTVISMIPSIIVYLIFQRQFVEGMSDGAVK
ncbi:carbohydrate ABC transporter permease [Paenibacillus pasadenensis]|uniref:carbohydrate ABC transporter permease n=1 Tax=Paenibacillus pasadenensis TaxID=217090 RepID=UPI00203AF296|nr:carbohydrate ABC transporter permease [Paenibacillus pasadenensis]MCM3746984.1 carbohydrate ABC transporter permease [Paenibacillus pasadenensis]